MSVHRLDLGHLVRPAAEWGGPHPRVESSLAYLVRRPEGRLLFDTGLGRADEETEAHYRPVRRDLAAALARVGAAPAEVSIVVNCHLHFDHCGGNPGFAGVPILVQARELATARGTVDYTVESLVDFPGVRYEPLDGEAEIMPGVWLVPTPGHTEGHQSLVVREPDGTVILAGQAHHFASDFASDWLARRTAGETAPPRPPFARFLDRLADFDPRRVVFAHDAAVWEP